MSHIEPSDSLSGIINYAKPRGEKVGLYPHFYYWLSMYASLTERRGQRTFWYTDRKQFALGRHITDEMLAPLAVPR